MDAEAVILRQGSAPEQRRAADALGRRGQSAAPAVPALIEALNTDDAATRCACITSLGLIGTAAKAAEPKLRELALDPDREVSKRSAAVLRQLSRFDR